MESTTKVLIIEDDVELAQLTSRYLTAHKFDVEVMHCGASGLKYMKEHQPHIVLLDLMLPGKLSGEQVCKKLRDNYNGIIVVLTAKQDNWSEIDCLNIGADSFIRKPVSPKVLLAHLTANLRRLNREVIQQELPDVVQFENFKFFTKKREVYVSDNKVELQDAEYDLLQLLVENSGQVMSRNDLYQSLRGIDWDGVDRMVDLRISKIRNKLQRYGCVPKIKTVFKKGYLFMVPE